MTAQSTSGRHLGTLRIVVLALLDPVSDLPVIFAPHADTSGYTTYDVGDLALNLLDAARWDTIEYAQEAGERVRSSMGLSGLHELTDLAERMGWDGPLAERSVRMIELLTSPWNVVEVDLSPVAVSVTLAKPGTVTP